MLGGGGCRLLVSVQIVRRTRFDNVGQSCVFHCVNSFRVIHSDNFVQRFRHDTDLLVASADLCSYFAIEPIGKARPCRSYRITDCMTHPTSVIKHSQSYEPENPCMLN